MWWRKQVSVFMDWVNDLNDRGFFGFNPQTGEYQDIVPAPKPVKEKPKTDYVPVEIIKKLEKRYEYSPDFSFIRRHKYIPVFIYQHELLKNGKDSGILLPDESKWLGKAYSTFPHFTLDDIGDEMPRRTMAFVSGDNKSVTKGSCLSGEVYALTPEAVLNLDRYMQNSEESDRFEKSFTLTEQISPFKGRSSPTMKCWVYLGHEPFFDKIKRVKRPVTKDYNLNKWFFIP